MPDTASMRPPKRSTRPLKSLELTCREDCHPRRPPRRWLRPNDAPADHLLMQLRGPACLRTRRPGVPRAQQKRCLTQSEEDGRGEIPPGADKRRQSECDSDGNRKTDVDTPVFGQGAVGMCRVGDFAVVGL